MSDPGPSLLPREHGAYAQLAVALVSALALAPAWRSLCHALVVAALFLASEPLLVLLGRRGEAALHAGRDSAGRRLATLGATATPLLIFAWAGQPTAYGLSLLLPAMLGLGLFGLFLAGRERTGAGEVLAAWAFATATLSVGLLGGAGFRASVLLACFLGGIFTLGTALVHGHLLALRKRRSAWRLIAFLLGAGVTAGVGLLGALGLGPRFGGAAFLPMTAAALVIWIAPPAPHRLKAVGWAAAACALAGAAMAVASLR